MTARAHRGGRGSRALRRPAPGAVGRGAAAPGPVGVHVVALALAGAGFLLALSSTGCGDGAPSSAQAAPAPAAPAKLTEAEARRTPGFGTRWKEAWSLYEQGDHRSAIRVLVRAIEAEPRFPDGYRLLSRLYVELGDDGKAAEVFEICTRTFPDRPEPWYYRGLHEYRLGRTGDARASFRRAVAMDPDDAQARYRLGLVLLNEGDFPGAREHLARAWVIDGQDPMIAGALAEALRVTGDYEAVERVAGQALARTPDAAELGYQLAQVRIRAGRDAEAEELLRRAVTSDPRHQQAHFLLAQLLARTGRDDESRWEKCLADRLADYDARHRLLRSVLALRPDEPKVPLGLAELELSVRKGDRALVWLDRAEALGGPPDRIAAGRAEAHYLRGEIAAGDTFLAAAGDGPSTELARAARELALGDRPSATARLDGITGHASSDRLFLCRMADLYARAGEREQARETFTLAAATPVPAELP